MTIKNDVWLYESMLKGNKNSQVINPTVCEQISVIPDSEPLEKCISYGISSYGYDVRCSSIFKVFNTPKAAYHGLIVDPKNFDETLMTTYVGDVCVIPPNSFVLTCTIEYFRIPRNIMALCVGKSTYARCGIICNTTPLEPEWEGHITIELSNTTPLPVKIYANEGIAQVLFFEADRQCAKSYKDRKGKYQGQTGVTLPKV